MNEKIGLLYRVSSLQQETDGNSLDVQREMGRKISQKLGVGYIEYDEGVQSSFNVEVNLRPKLVELLNEIQKENGIRKVWVFNTDRLGRTSQSWYSILKLFLDYGVQIYIGEDYKKPYDLTNSVDKLVIGVLSLISQYDNELRRLRSVMGKRNSLKSGNTYLGSTIPFGYSVKGKKLFVNVKESEYVKKIFSMYDEGKSSMNIKIFLDKQLDIKPRRSRYGWNIGTIQKMMRNKLYIGEQVWEWKEKLPNGEEHIVETITIDIPPIVEIDLWKRVNDRMNLHLNDIRNKNNQNEIPLLKGILKCKKCGLVLSHRFRETNHYYGRCKETKWKYNNKKFDISECSIGKSLRIEETDVKVFETIIDVIRNSKKIKEQYKTKNLTPKWEDETLLKKRIGTTKKYLNEKIKERNNCENEIVEIEYDIRTNKITPSLGEKLKTKFLNTIEVLNEEVLKLQKELKLVSNSKGWVNWIDNMSKEIDSIRNTSIENKRDFINKNILEVKVEYDKNLKSHKLDIDFRFPIVGDKFQYDLNESRDDKGFKKYEILEGSTNKTIEVPLVTYRKKQNENDREKLNSEIIKLKEEGGFSLQEICNKLNEKKLFTPTKKKWDKPKLSSYYKTLKGKVPKKL